MPNVKKMPILREHWLWIRNRIELKGLSLVSIAKDHGYNVRAITLVKDYRYPAIEKIIADTLGYTPQDLFQDRYTPDGEPLGRRYPREIRLTERKKICNGKEEEKLP